jgi:hypothetical protein
VSPSGLHAVQEFDPSGSRATTTNWHGIRGGGICSFTVFRWFFPVYSPPVCSPVSTAAKVRSRSMPEMPENQLAGWSMKFNRYFNRFRIPVDKFSDWPWQVVVYSSWNLIFLSWNWLGHILPFTSGQRAIHKIPPGALSSLGVNTHWVNLVYILVWGENFNQDLRLVDCIDFISDSTPQHSTILIIIMFLPSDSVQDSLCNCDLHCFHQTWDSCPLLCHSSLFSLPPPVSLKDCKIHSCLITVNFPN